MSYESGSYDGEVRVVITGAESTLESRVETKQKRIDNGSNVNRLDRSKNTRLAQIPEDSLRN